MAYNLTIIRRTAGAAGLSAALLLLAAGSGPAHAQSVGQWSAGQDAYAACMQGASTPGKSQFCRYIQCLREMTYLPNGRIDPAAAGQAGAACRHLLEAFMQRHAPSLPVPDTTVPVNTGHVPNGSPTGLYGGPGETPMGWKRRPPPGVGPWGLGNPPPRGPAGPGKMGPKPPAPQAKNPQGPCGGMKGVRAMCAGKNANGGMTKPANAPNRQASRIGRPPFAQNSARVQPRERARVNRLHGQRLNSRRLANPRFTNPRITRSAAPQPRPRFNSRAGFAGRGNFGRTAMARGGFGRPALARAGFARNAFARGGHGRR
jgi:hypothetical protein